MGRKVAIVTGADGGIGIEFCRALGRRGFPIVMVSNREKEIAEAAETIRRECGVDTYPLCLDLCDISGLSRLPSFLKENDLQPYILVNNAGIFSFKPVLDTPPGKIEAFIALHVSAVTELTRLIAREMTELKEGYILNMSSMSCWMPMPGIAMYSATKAYIRVFTRALHYELRDSGVRVMAAAPGGIATDLFGLPEHLKRLALNLGAISRPEKFAEKAIRRLLKGKMQYINGFTNRLAIVFVGCSPTWMRMLIKRKLLDR